MRILTIEAVAVTREDDEEGLHLEWIVEGGISALESPGVVLFASAEGNDMCDDDGSCQVQIVSEFDEQKERGLFEKHFNVAGKTGIVWSGGDECYRSIRGFNIDLQYAGELTRQLQGWLACAKSRSEQ
jgi:hypothetical protein